MGICPLQGVKSYLAKGISSPRTLSQSRRVFRPHTVKIAVKSVQSSPDSCRWNRWWCFPCPFHSATNIRHNSMFTLITVITPILEMFTVTCIKANKISGGIQVVLAVKNPPANAGEVWDEGSIPGSGRSPGGGHGNPLQYSCLGNPRDRGTEPQGK